MNKLYVNNNRKLRRRVVADIVMVVLWSITCMAYALWRHESVLVVATMLVFLIIFAVSIIKDGDEIRRLYDELDDHIRDATKKVQP